MSLTVRDGALGLTKMHGTENDFVVIDLRSQTLANPE